jgi:hypothetical protein
MRVLLLGILLTSSSLMFADSTDSTKNSENTTFKNQDTEVNPKPRLEDFATYNDFLRAMYLYKKTEEETIKPNVIINPPSKGQIQPEYTPMDKERDITSWGEAIPAQSPTPLD